MTTRLEVGKKNAPVLSGPVLSPKIIESFTARLHYKTPSNQEASQALSLYLQGVVPSQPLVRAALRRVALPSIVVVAELQNNDPATNESTELTHQWFQKAHELIRGQQILLYMGGSQLCVILPFEDESDSSNEVSTALKKAARALGKEVNIGLSEAASRHTALPHAYLDAINAATLGKQLWGKPYVYRQADIGLVACIADGDSMRTQSRLQSQELLAALARPKVLLPTLKMFFAHSMSPTEVARVARIHRNTVIYRLDKIRQHTGLDPLDFNDATQLYLAVSLQEIDYTGPPDVEQEDNVCLRDKVTVALLGGSTQRDAKIRQFMAGVGVSLAKEFALYLVETTANLANVDMSTTFIAKVKLSESRWLMVDNIPARQAARQAEQLVGKLPVGSKVTYLTSQQARGQLCNSLIALQYTQSIASQKWSTARVVNGGFASGLLALIGTKEAREFACHSAETTVQGIRTQKHLEATTHALLDSSLNLTLAARRLKVHRNTLIYRVNRIRQLTGYDLTKFEDAVQVRLAFLLNELT